MKYILDPLAGILVAVFGIVIHPLVAAAFAWAATRYSIYWAIGCLPFVVGFIAVLCAKWDTEATDGYVRGDLPRWAAVFETPDERLPGDVRGEPSVKWAYAHLGKTVCAMYWLLERNRGMGISFTLGRPLPDGQYLDGSLWGFQELSNGAWRRVWKLGSWGQFCVGNQTTNYHGKIAYCRPWFSIKSQHNGMP